MWRKLPRMSTSLSTLDTSRSALFSSWCSISCSFILLIISSPDKYLWLHHTGTLHREAVASAQHRKSGIVFQQQAQAQISRFSVIVSIRVASMCLAIHLSSFPSNHFIPDFAAVTATRFESWGSLDCWFLSLSIVFRIRICLDLSTKTLNAHLLSLRSLAMLFCQHRRGEPW